MVSAIAILAAITGLAYGQPAGEKPSGECCDTKTVGGVTYTLSGQMDTKMYNCLSDCVYQIEGQTGAQFCFAMGDEKVECNDKPPMEGSEKPPMEGSEKPPMEGSEKPPGCKCGVKKTDRIVGGDETEVNEYPWMAAVADPQESFFCGSTLVASEWVVSAAHCMYKDQELTVPRVESELRIVLGDHDRTLGTTESILPRIVVEVSKIIKHPDYDTGTSDADIVLLKLSIAVDLKTYTPACMANTGDDFTDKKAWTYGWGALSYGTGDYPDKLQDVAVTIVSTATCQAAVDDLGWKITDGMLCAGGVEGEDTCQGDSGGPLTVDVAGQHTLVGDVSFGDGCAKANRYGVYAKTSFFRQWIDTTVAAEGGATYCPA